MAFLTPHVLLSHPIQCLEIRGMRALSSLSRAHNPTIHQPERIPVQGIYQLVCADGTPCSTRRLEQQRCYLQDSKPRYNDCQCRCLCFHDLPTLNIILHYETRTDITYHPWTYTMIRCSHAYLFMTFAVLGGNHAIIFLECSGAGLLMFGLWNAFHYVISFRYTNFAINQPFIMGL
jgi:hypothetical protein